jgi:hypothetical protein
LRGLSHINIVLQIGNNVESAAFTIHLHSL